MLASFLFGEFLLHIPCWRHFYLVSFSDTSRAVLFFLVSFPGSFSWGVSLTHPLLVSFLSGELLLHIPCWRHFYLWSFSYTSRTGFILFQYFLWYIRWWLLFMRGVSLTHPGCFIFIWGVSPTHPVLVSFLSEAFLLHIPCCSFLFVCFLFLEFLLGSFSYTSRAGWILTREFLLHILCWLHLYLESFSYTSCADFLFLWGVSLTHPMLPSFLCGEFLLHIPCLSWFFMQGVSLTHHMLALLLCGEFLIHIPC